MALKHASTYRPGPAKHSGADLPENRIQGDEYEGHNKDLADWYFRVLTGIYGQDTLFRKYPNEPALALGRRAAIRALQGKSQAALAHGERLLEAEPGQWPPTPGDFAKLCVIAPEHLPFEQKQLEHKASKETGRAWLQRIRGDLGCQSK